MFRLPHNTGLTGYVLKLIILFCSLNLHFYLEPPQKKLDLWCNTKEDLESCNSAAIHACKPIAYRNRAPLVLSLKCALISRTSIKSWKQNVTLPFEGRRLLPSSFNLKNLKILSYGNFLIVLCANTIFIYWGVNYICKVLKLKKAITAK